MLAETQLSQPSIAPRLGTIDRYALARVLGQGGMGIVYEAWDTRLEREVALKLITPRAGHDDEAQARLVREARMMATLAHPNIVQAYDVGVADGRVYVAMQLVRGTTLRAWSEDPARTFAERLRVLIAAGRGLEAAHAAQVVHRDFKPDNVLIGATGVPQVTDFGIARRLPSGEEAEALAETRLTQTGAVLGTPAYMAPEQAHGLVPTAAADQFSFCVTAYELLAGQRPFAGATAMAVLANILTGTIHAAPAEAAWPIGLRQALRRGLSVEPRDRFPTMAELLAALERAALPPRRRSVVRRIVIAASVLALSAGAAALGLGGARAGQETPALQLATVIEPVSGRAAATTREAMPAWVASRSAPPADAHGRRTPARATMATSAAVIAPVETAPVERTPAEPAPEPTDPAEVTRLGRLELPLVDGLRARRELRVTDMPGYAATLAETRAAIERGDEAGARAGMRELRRRIDAVQIDAAFVAAKQARLRAKRADARGPADQLAELDAELDAGARAAREGRFAEANHALDQAAKRFPSER